jgi:hypothetical protein
MHADVVVLIIFSVVVAAKMMRLRFSFLLLLLEG